MAWQALCSASAAVQPGSCQKRRGQSHSGQRRYAYHQRGPTQCWVEREGAGDWKTPDTMQTSRKVLTVAWPWAESAAWAAG